MKPLRSEEIYGNWATLLLPVNANNSIDYGALAEEIDVLISMKVNGIYSNGTAGEFYNQTEREFDRVSSLLAEKCNAAGMPFQLGVSHMSPQLSLKRLQRVIPLAPSAVQVILPDWFPPEMSEIIDYLKVMAEAAFPCGLVLYNPPHAKKQLSPENFGAIRSAGVALAGCKVAGGDERWYRSMKEQAGEMSLFVPGHTLATGYTQGAAGAYSNVACLHPGAAQRWYELIRTDIANALEMEKRIQQFMEECIAPYIRQDGYSNQAVDKFMAALGAWAPLSPRLRWPYKWVPESHLNRVRARAKKILPEFFESPV